MRRYYGFFARARRGLTLAILCVLSLAWVQTLYAQDNDGSVTQIKRAVLFLCRFSPDSTFTPLQQRLLYESMVIRFGDASDQVDLQEYSEFNISEDADPGKIAELSGVDAYILAEVNGGMDKAATHFAAEDTNGTHELFQTDVESPIDSRFRNVFGGLWVPVMRLIQDTIHPVSHAATLTIKAPPSTTVSLGPKITKTLGDSAETSASLASPATYNYSAYLPGYRPENGHIFLDGDQVLDLKLVRRLPVSFDIGMEWLAYPSLRVNVGIIPDKWEAFVGAHFYDLGFYPSAPSGAGVSFFKDFGLIQLTAGTVFIPSDPRSAFAFALGAGAHLRILSSAPARLDPLGAGGFFLDFEGRYAISPILSFFAELEPMFTFSPDPRFATASAGSQGTSLANLTLVLGPMYIEPLHFQMGLRVQP